MTVKIQTVGTEVWRVACFTGMIPHIGLLLKNSFACNGYQYTHLLIHALSNRQRNGFAKFDFFFCNQVKVAGKRLCGLVGQDEKHMRKTFIGKSMATGKQLRQVLIRELNRQFDYSMTSIREIAFGNYNIVNCMMAALRIQAVLFEQNESDVLDDYIEFNRGWLIRYSRTNINDFERVPCTDIFWWMDLKTKQEGRFKLQQHITSETILDGATRILRGVMTWSIHNAPFRIIERNDTSERKWFERARGHNHEFMDNLFENIV